MNDRQCEHWTGTACRLGLYGGRPSPGTCRQCKVRLALAGESERDDDDSTHRIARSYQDRLVRGEAGRMKRSGCRRCGVRITPWGVVSIDDGQRWSRWDVPASVRGPARRRG